MAKFIRAACAGFLVIAVAVIVAAILFDKQIAEFAASRALGRTVEIDGTFEMDYSLVPTLRATGLSVANAEWSARDHMFSAEALTLSVDLRSLFDGRRVIPQISLVSPKVLLETSPQGELNWRTGDDGNGQALPEVRRVQVKDATVIYLDHAAGVHLRLAISRLDAGLTAAAPATLDASGTLEGRPFQLSATGGPVGNMMDGRHPYPVRFAVVTNGARLTGSGRIARPMELGGLDLKVHAEGEELRAFLPADDQALAQSFALDARLTSSNGRWTMAGLDARLGKNRLAGSIAVDMSGERPYIEADLRAQRLDADLVRALADRGPGVTVRRQPLHASPFPMLRALSGWDANVRIHAGQITGMALPVQQLAVRLSLQRGELRVAPFHVNVGGGELHAEGRVDMDTRSGEIRVRARHFPIAPVVVAFTQVEDPARLYRGEADGHLALSFSRGAIGRADGRVTYRAPAARTRLVADIERLRGDGDPTSRLVVTGKLRGISVRMTLRGAPSLLLSDAMTQWPLSLDATVGRNRLKLNGAVGGLARRFEFDLDAAGPGTGQLGAAAGISLPALPPYRISGRVGGDRDTLSITDLEAGLGSSKLSGSAQVSDLGGSPRLAVDVQARTLAYRDFKSIISMIEAPSHREGGSGRPHWLTSASAQVNLSARRVIVPKGVVLRDVTIEGGIVDGRLRLDPLRFRLGGGKVALHADLGLQEDGTPAGILRARIDDLRLREALRPAGLGQQIPGMLTADISLDLSPGKPEAGGYSEIRYREAGRGNDLKLVLQQSASGFQIGGGGHFLGAPFRLNGKAGPLTAYGVRYPFEFGFHLLETDGRIHGTLRRPFELDGLRATLALAGPDPRRIEPVVGFRLPELPPYRLEGELTQFGDRWRFSGINGTVGDSDLSGTISVDNRRRIPYVEARLHSAHLDFDDLAGLVGGTPSSAPQETSSTDQRRRAAQQARRQTVLPGDPLDFDVLSEFNADLVYTARSADSDTLPLDSFSINFHLKDGRLRFSPLLLGAAGGVVKADIRLVDKPGEHPVRGSAEIAIEKLALKEILGSYGVTDDSRGRIDGRISVRTRGDSVAGMLGSLEGQGQILMRDGALDALLVELGGLDGGESLLLWLGHERLVDVRCASIAASADNGVVVLDSAVVDTTDTKFTAEGRIDLGKELLDLRLRAHPKDFSLFVARAPFHVAGSFREPDAGVSWTSLLLRGAAALALSAVTPPAALLALIEPGTGKDANCPLLLDQGWAGFSGKSGDE